MILKLKVLFVSVTLQPYHSKILAREFQMSPSGIKQQISVSKKTRCMLFFYEKHVLTLVGVFCAFFFFFLSSVFFKRFLSIIKCSVNSHHYMLAQKRDVKCCCIIHIVMKTKKKKVCKLTKTFCNVFTCQRQLAFGDSEFSTV